MMFNMLSRILTKAFFIIDIFQPVTSEVEIQFDFFEYTLEFEN